jgi:RNA-directed DNA polymerase
LANIALHGLEEKLKKTAESLDIRYPDGKQTNKRDKRASLTFVRYADDFVVLHEDKTVVQGCREIISEWLNGIDLELKPEKTRLTHTLKPKLSEDGVAGFDFLGHHIQQHPVGKYRSDRDSKGRILGFDTLITPSKKAIKADQDGIKGIILKHRSSPQEALIKDLNPVIRGWTSYYSNSDTKIVGELSKQDHLTYLKLRRWAFRRCGSLKKAYQDLRNCHMGLPQAYPLRPIASGVKRAGASKSQTWCGV